MSRYLLLLLFNLPFIVAGLLNALTQYKLNRSTKKRFIVQICTWLAIFIGLIFANPLYEWLFSNNLTESEPLSLFDVVQITGIVSVFYIANRTRAKLDRLDRKLNDIHQELSIELSRKN